MNQGGPKNGIAVHSRGVQKYCESQSYLSGTYAKPQASSKHGEPEFGEVRPH